MAVSRLRVFLIAAIVVTLAGLTLSIYLTYLLPELNPVQPLPVATGSATPVASVTAVDPNASTAARVLSHGKLRVGIRFDFRPFGFLDGNGQLAGFDVDLAHELARRWLDDANAVEFVQVTNADRILRLLNGEVDLLVAGLEVRRERDAFIDFSQEYFMGGQSLLVRTGAGIGNLAGLQSRTVAVIQDSPALDTLQAIASRAQINLTVRTYQEYPQAIAALVGGQVDAVSGESIDLVQFAQANPGLQVTGGRLTRIPYAIGLLQGDSDFRELVNATLQAMKQEGVYDALYRKWFATDEPLTLEITPGEPRYAFPQLPAQLQLPALTKIQQVLERGRLIAAVHTDMAPFGIREEGGRLSGFDIDLVREFARRWLGDENAIELVSGDVSEQIARLEQGEIDLIAAALPRHRQYADALDFSQTYASAPQSGEPYSIGLPHSDSMFRELVNVTLQEMKADGAYDRLFNRWFGAGQTAYAIAITPGDADYLLLPGASQNQTTLRVTAAGESAIGRIRARNNVMLVGVSQTTPPFSFVDSNDQPAGFDVELVQAIAQQWGVSIQFVNLTLADRIDHLVAQEVDLIAGALTHTKEREAALDFSQTYFVSGQSLLVRRDAGIGGLADLNSRVVATVDGTTYADQIQAQADAASIAITLQPYADYPTAVEALKAGQVHALTADSVTLAQFAQANPELVGVGGLLTQEPYGLGLPAGDTYFQHLLNATLQDLKTSGAYDQLYHKWFGAETTPYALEILPGTWPYTFGDSPTVLDAPVQSRLDQILARRKIIAGVTFDFSPFGVLDQSGQVTGFDVDLVKEFAKRWLGDEAAVEFLPVTPSNRLQMTIAGQVDLVAAAMPHSREQDELIDVSQTYFLDSLSQEPYSLGLPNYDERLRDLVNFTLQEMKLDGSYDRLVARWFGTAPVHALELWPGVSTLRVNLTPMRRIPAGEFVRGNNNGFPDERPEQTIMLNEFYIDQYEVTNRLYAQCVSAGRCTLPRLPRSVNFSGYYTQSSFGNYPVIWVSWQDAANYCQFVGKRLPSEAEWEKAARGGQAFLYPWGNDEPSTQANFNYSQGDVAPVGAFAGDVSGYGVNDLAGNVREWVADWYQWDYYSSAQLDNPGGPATSVTRVLRGGSWNDIAIYVRTTVRKNYLPDSYDSNLGFRCASSAAPSQ